VRSRADCARKLRTNIARGAIHSTLLGLGGARQICDHARQTNEQQLTQRSAREIKRPGLIMPAFLFHAPGPASAICCSGINEKRRPFHLSQEQRLKSFAEQHTHTHRARERKRRNRHKYYTSLLFIFALYCERARRRRLFGLGCRVGVRDYPLFAHTERNRKWARLCGFFCTCPCVSLGAKFAPVY
jgi:hypothetical protein